MSSYTFNRIQDDLPDRQTLTFIVQRYIRTQETQRKQAKIYESIVKVINHIAVVILQSEFIMVISELE